jgi:hypothetical protein
MKKATIKPVGYLKITKTCKTHIPKLIRRETGAMPGEEIPFIINASSVLLYDPRLSLKELLASIDVLKRDIRLRVQEISKDGVVDATEATMKQR